MLKNKKNNLDNRREFYIYRVIRDGKMYDDNEIERKTITKNQKKLIPHLKLLIKKRLVMQNRLDIMKILKDTII